MLIASVADWDYVKKSHDAQAAGNSLISHTILNITEEKWRRGEPTNISFWMNRVLCLNYSQRAF